jgi:hypothetical protein
VNQVGKLVESGACAAADASCPAPPPPPEEDKEEPRGRPNKGGPPARPGAGGSPGGDMSQMPSKSNGGDGGDGGDGRGGPPNGGRPGQPGGHGPPTVAKKAASMVQAKAPIGKRVAWLAESATKRLRRLAESLAPGKRCTMAKAHEHTKHAKRLGASLARLKAEQLRLRTRNAKLNRDLSKLTTRSHQAMLLEASTSPARIAAEEEHQLHIDTSEHALFEAQEESLEGVPLDSGMADAGAVEFEHRMGGMTTATETQAIRDEESPRRATRAGKSHQDASTMAVCDESARRELIAATKRVERETGVLKAQTRMLEREVHRLKKKKDTA